MKKLILLVCIALNIVAAEDVAPKSKWEDVKTALTSKEAKITYGVVGLGALGTCAYFALRGKWGASLGIPHNFEDLVIEGRTLAPQIDEFIDNHHGPQLGKDENFFTNFFAKYNCNSARMSIGMEWCGDDTFTFDITINNKDQSQLNRIVRDIMLARSFTLKYAIVKTETNIYGTKTKASIYYKVIKNK